MPSTASHWMCLQTPTSFSQTLITQRVNMILICEKMGVSILKWMHYILSSLFFQNCVQIVLKVSSDKFMAVMISRLTLPVIVECAVTASGPTVQIRNVSLRSSYSRAASNQSQDLVDKSGRSHAWTAWLLCLKSFHSCILINFFVKVA